MISCFLFDRWRWPFNRPSHVEQTLVLISFLVSIPDSNSIAVCRLPIFSFYMFDWLLVLHIFWYVLLFLDTIHSSFKRESRRGDSNPRPLEQQASTLTTRPCRSPIISKSAYIATSRSNLDPVSLIYVNRNNLWLNGFKVFLEHLSLLLRTEWMPLLAIPFVLFFPGCRLYFNSWLFPVLLLLLWLWRRQRKIAPRLTTKMTIMKPPPNMSSVRSVSATRAATGPLTLEPI